MRYAALLALVVGAATPMVAQRSDTIVKNAGAPRYAGVATLVPEVTIGGPDATADEYIFVSIRVLLAARDGSVWVSDGRFPMGPFSLRRYDPSGKFVRNVGARGDGPGEWQIPGHLTELRAGRVVLRDGVVGRPFTFYRSNGDYDTTWAMHSTTVSYINADTAGNIWMMAAPGARLSPDGAFAVMRIAPSGAVIDTVQEPQGATVSNPAVTVSRGGRPGMRITAPYMPSPFRAWSPHGYYAVGITSRYAIDLLKPASSGALWKQGDPVTSIRRTVAPVAVVDAEREEQRAIMDARVAAAAGTTSGSLPDVPREKPPIRFISFDLDGRLWVSISQPSERFEPPPPPPARAGAAQQSVPVLRWREPNVYDLFESSGTYLGRVAVPYNVRLQISAWAPIQSRGNHVWGVAVDSDGVQTVHRYRIAWR